MNSGPPAGNNTRRTSTRATHPGQSVHFEFSSTLARKVCVAGTFNDWKPETTEMIRVENGRWVKDLVLPAGTYEYRLVVDGVWMPDPNADHAVMNPFGERNSLLTVTAPRSIRSTAPST